MTWKEFFCFTNISPFCKTFSPPVIIVRSRFHFLTCPPLNRATTQDECLYWSTEKDIIALVNNSEFKFDAIASKMKEIGSKEYSWKKVENFRFYGKWNNKICYFWVIFTFDYTNCFFSIKNKKELRQKFFFKNQDIFENLIREIYLIYAEATNTSIEDANNLCKYIENNSGKFLAFIPNKVLENIDLLIRECNQYEEKDFKNIKYYANKSISSLRRFAGTAYFSFATYDVFHCEH